MASPCRCRSTLPDAAPARHENRFAPTTHSTTRPDAATVVQATGSCSSHPASASPKKGWNGFYLWCRLPDGRDAAEVARAALREGVVLAPGDVFSPSRSATDFMRFNVAQMADPRVYAVLARALKCSEPPG